MSTVTDAASLAQITDYATTDTKKTSKYDYGHTVGSPELSEAGKKYYTQLKQKFSNMDFILVSEDKKEEAKAQAGSYANANRMVVLIDTEKVEKMAADKSYRAQYEGIIQNAGSQISQLKTSLGSSGANVKTYGMQVKDNGTASFFAVIDKSLEAQKKRIEKKSEEKADAKKADAKKAEQKKKSDRLNKDAQTDKTEDDTVTIEASSIEELMKKIQDMLQEQASDNTLTPQEKNIGQHVDYRG